MLILADDLTGAADAAAGFAVRGLRTTVVLDNENLTPDLIETDVVSVDVASRAMGMDDAVAATVSALRRFRGAIARVTPGAGGGGLFVKIDSTIRGHVAATVTAVMDTLEPRQRRVVVCPAFPALGRTVVDRRVHVDGIPLPGGDLGELLGRLVRRHDLLIADARSDDDLAALVRSVVDDDEVVWVGSAGLARHIAMRHVTSGAARDRAVEHAVDAPSNLGCDHVTVVAGSQHERTDEQVGRLVAGTRLVRLDPRLPIDLDGLAAALATSDGLVLTGGHTARAVLDLLEVHQLGIGGEVELGIPWGIAEHAGRRLAVVTKAGGFGTRDSLRRAVAFLSRQY